ncbi:hypothetical protein SXCC_01999 [Gluconacetobacter sp. SXCC-1]|nr:hypothetical protein SXCC_01999 [Gluconacetobacter sp. SXCC-1]
MVASLSTRYCTHMAGIPTRMLEEPILAWRRLCFANTWKIAEVHIHVATFNRFTTLGTSIT